MIKHVVIALATATDRPISRLALWAIRAPLSIEPFIDMNIAPGAEFTCSIKYDSYKISKAE